MKGTRPLDNTEIRHVSASFTRPINLDKFLYFLWVICFCITGCADEGVLLSDLVVGRDVLDEDVVTEIPIALQELLWGNQENLLASLARAMETDNKERVSFLIRRIHLRERQAEYYTKYIDAGGIIIVGNRDVWNWCFYAARDIVLTMTSKHPRLREVLSPGYLHRFQWAQELIADGTLRGHRQILISFPSKQS